jgi:hypothetical protein
MSITFERAKEHIGVIPTMHPRPTFDNINQAVLHLVRKLQQLPAPHQSTRNGYAGKIMSVQQYALLDTQAWTDWPYPGPHHTFPDGADRASMEQAKTVWTANSDVYNSEQNVDRAVIATLDISIPDDFKSGGFATNGWSGNINGREIIANLKDKYGTPGPADKEKIEAIFMKPYNPSRPIESMFKELETARMMSILAHVPYTDAQILDKALTKIQVTNQYRNAIVDWALAIADDANNNNWDAFKDHFIQAYTANQAALTVTQGGYHGAANAHEEYNDDDSLGSIQASLASLQMANNASAQATNDQLSNLTANTQQQIAQLTQQMAMLANSHQMQMMPQPMPPPTYNMQTGHHQAQMAQQPHMQPPIPAYMPSPNHMQPTNQANYDRGGNRRNNGRGGRNNQRNQRGGRRNAPPPQNNNGNYTTYGNIPPPNNQMTAPYGQQPRTPYSNTVKHFANWNYCYTCGFDVEEWHTSTTCPNPKPGHQQQCNRQNFQGYKDAGHRPSAKAQHKQSLPPNT